MIAALHFLRHSLIKLFSCVSPLLRVLTSWKHLNYSQYFRKAICKACSANESLTFLQWATTYQGGIFQEILTPALLFFCAVSRLTTYLDFTTFQHHIRHLKVINCHWCCSKNTSHSGLQFCILPIITRLSIYSSFNLLY